MSMALIEPGKKADLLFLRLDAPAMRPEIHLVSNLVHYGHQGLVDAVMVDGEFLLRDGRVTCMDEASVLREAQEATAGAWRRLVEQNPDLQVPGALLGAPA